MRRAFMILMIMGSSLVNPSIVIAKKAPQSGSIETNEVLTAVWLKNDTIVVKPT